MALKLGKRLFTELYSVILVAAIPFITVNANILIEETASSSKESIIRLEAVFLTKFVNFITWPDESNIENEEVPFTITVLGDHFFADKLQQIYTESEITVFGKDIKIKQIASIEDLGFTNILFISESQKSNLSKITETVKSKPILTVSDTRGFAENNVHINFYLKKNNTLHFEINESMIKASSLVMSVRLLSIAKIVGGEL